MRPDTPTATGSDLVLGRGQRLTWVVTVIVALSLASFIVFGVATSSAELGQDSALAKKYTDIETAGDNDAPQQSFDTAWGQTSGSRTLVLCDSVGAAPDVADAETHAIVAANLATHFGRAQTMPMKDYTVDAMQGYDLVVYIGVSSGEVIPDAFHTDMLRGDVPVLWAGHNIADVANGSDNAHRRFIDTYGWDPVASRTSEAPSIDGIVYNGRALTRNGELSGPITVPDIVNDDVVEVLASTTGEPVEPWAVRSSNLTYIGENPLTYVDETNRYLAFADLYFDLLAPGTPPSRQAAVRLEDVDAAANPADLRAITDFLADRGIPFQVAVVPFRVAKSPRTDQDSWIGLSLADRPAVVKELRHMQERGGTLIQHGTTHQFATLKNPYSGSSGADFEFYRAQCSRTAGPTFEIEPCVNDSHIVDTGPVGSDTVDGWVERLEEGRQVFHDLDLGDVDIFETPHYLASSNAYAAMAKVYPYRYERSHYFPGQLGSEQAPYQRARDQFFPYTVHDLYGSTVLPENLGNITEAEQNNHAVRDPAFIIAGAEANLAVRQSTASFFYHPFLGVEQLRETVDGIEDLGYTFVAATDLK